MMSTNYECIIVSKNKDLKDFCFKLQNDEKRKLVLVLLGELIGTININIGLSSHSSSEFYLATLLKGKSDLYINYISNHIGEESKSKFELYGLLSEKARKKSSMKIVFGRGAINAVGSEREKVTLMSESNQNLSSPIIESCEESAHGTHSSSTGHLEQEQIEYLMARGINEAQARILLIKSGLLNFLKQVKDRDVVEYILRKVENETR